MQISINLCHILSLRICSSRTGTTIRANSFRLSQSSNSNSNQYFSKISFRHHLNTFSGTVDSFRSSPKSASDTMQHGDTLLQALSDKQTDRENGISDKETTSRRHAQLSDITLFTNISVRCCHKPFHGSQTQQKVRSDILDTDQTFLHYSHSMLILEKI